MGIIQMKSLITYITEKLVLNKDSKPHGNLIWHKDKKEIEQFIRKKIYEIGELDLCDVFPNVELQDLDDHVINTIYYEGDKFAYSYYDGYERWKEIKNLNHIFNGEHIQKIYDYLNEH